MPDNSIIMQAITGILILRNQLELVPV